MNIYGDYGNLICLTKRCQWRRIEVKVDELSIGDEINSDKYDLYFFGGGQDQQQIAVSRDLKKKNGKLLKKAVEQKAVVLAICGGFQLLGHYYQPAQGPTIWGVGLLDLITIAGKKRMIGNVLVELEPGLIKTKQITYKNQDRISKISISKIIGFENHSGQTFLGKKVKPLGKVLKGFGNNGKDKKEGTYFGTVFGCYLHGSLLPKNPHFADFLIRLALERRYKNVHLAPLDDSLEWETHQAAIKRTYQTK
jgi:CobQ-like glutamine amidotransferase family enzyme